MQSFRSEGASLHGSGLDLALEHKTFGLWVTKLLGSAVGFGL